MKAVAWIAAAVAVVVAATIAVMVLTLPKTVRLHVDVLGLPGGVAAAVTVTGPVSYAITGSNERNVPAGTYVLRIEPVRTSAGTAYADDERQPVTVSGERTSATVDYATIIPDTTKVLDYTNPGIVSVAGRTVTFTTDSPSRAALIPGNMFIVAEGPQTPDPLSRRVDKVTPTAAGIVVDTTPVKLSEALPAGHFDLADEPVAITPALFRAPAQPLLSLDFGKLLGGELTGGSCRVSAEKPPKLNLILDGLQPHFGGSFKWGLFRKPPVSIKIDATISPRIGFDAEISAAMSCAIERDKASGFRWLNTLCGKVIGKIAKIGPVSLRCKITPAVSLTLEVSNRTTFGLDATITGGIKDNKPRFGVSDVNTRNLSQEVFDGVEPTAKVSPALGLGIGLSGGDPSETAWLGLVLDLSAGPEFTAKAKSAALSLKFGVKLSAEAELDLRFKDFGAKKKLVELSLTFPLWHVDNGSFQRPAPPRTLRLGKISVNAPPTWRANVVPSNHQFSGFWVTTAKPCPDGQLLGGCAGFMVLDQHWINAESGASAKYQLDKPAAFMNAQDAGTNCPPLPRLGVFAENSPPRLLKSGQAMVGGHSAEYREWQITCGPRSEIMGGRPSDANLHVGFVERSWYLKDEQVLIVDDWKTPNLDKTLEKAVW
jgi:hypothetical protein